MTDTGDAEADVVNAILMPTSRVTELSVLNNAICLNARFISWAYSLEGH